MWRLVEDSLPPRVGGGRSPRTKPLGVDLLPVEVVVFKREISLVLRLVDLMPVILCEESFEEAALSLDL